MKLLYTAILNIIDAEQDVRGHHDHSIVAEYSVFSEGFFTAIFHQPSVQLFRFVSSTIVNRLIRNGKQGYNSVDDGDLCLHCYIGKERIFTTITDKKYPPGVAYRLLEEISRQDADMESLFKSYQDPNNDVIYRIESDLEETKTVLMQNVEKLFQRGDKLEDLIEKSERLSAETKTFYKRARTSNRWCPWFWGTLRNLGNLGNLANFASLAN